MHGNDNDKTHLLVRCMAAIGWMNACLLICAAWMNRFNDSNWILQLIFYAQTQINKYLSSGIGCRCLKLIFIMCGWPVKRWSSNILHVSHGIYSLDAWSNTNNVEVSIFSMHISFRFEILTEMLAVLSVILAWDNSMVLYDSPNRPASHRIVCVRKTLNRIHINNTQLRKYVNAMILNVALQRTDSNAMNEYKSDKFIIYPQMRHISVHF